MTLHVRKFFPEFSSIFQALKALFLTWNPTLMYSNHHFDACFQRCDNDFFLCYVYWSNMTHIFFSEFSIRWNIFFCEFSNCFLRYFYFNIDVSLTKKMHSPLKNAPLSKIILPWKSYNDWSKLTSTPSPSKFQLLKRHRIRKAPVVAAAPSRASTSYHRAVAFCIVFCLTFYPWFENSGSTS